MPQTRIEFWFEFASTYSYLSVLRLPTLAAKAGVKIIWRPFLLGPIFAAQGWDTSPFNIYAAKGDYMWRDMQRRCEALNVAFQKPNPFPQNSLLAARVAQCALDTPHGIEFCQNVYRMQFAEGKDISEPRVIAFCLQAASLPVKMIDAAQDKSNKLALRNATADAMQRGIFGAPSLTVGPELFWGDDQLEAAIAWCKAHTA